MKTVISLIAATIMLWSCQQPEEHKSVTNVEDYDQYLQFEQVEIEKKVSNLTKEVDFWSEKIRKQPRGFLYFDKLAKAYDQLFELTGDVTHLSAVDSLYQIAVDITDGKWKTANHIALASNAIKRHAFKSSLSHSGEALQTTSEKFGPLMMLFDAYMELGYFESAYYVLKDNYRPDSFDYLVRLSKYQDHVGNLDSAIVLMENAYEMVKYHDSSTALWAQTNLADMYGHAGRLENSYENYLAVLANDNDYRHALKGIAWLAYSNDKNLPKAKEIIRSLNQRTLLPDGHLILAEIAEQEGQLDKKKEHLGAFMSEASKAKYAGMYNKYLITVMAEEYQQFEEAEAIATQEIAHRATPLTYSLLAWVYELKGDHVKALEIIEQHVAGKTFEPEIIYHSGVIYLSNNKLKKGRKLLKEASEAAFELGPDTSAEINKLLHSNI